MNFPSAELAILRKKWLNIRDRISVHSLEVEDPMRLRYVFSLAVPLLLAIAVIYSAKSSAASFPIDRSKLDPVSSGCIDCHDGSDGMLARFCLLGQMSRDCGGHLISVVYDDLATRKSNLNPSSSLPPELALFNGMLTCVTCHGDNPHLGFPLAMDNTGSALCRACHRK